MNYQNLLTNLFLGISLGYTKVRFVYPQGPKEFSLTFEFKRTDYAPEGRCKLTINAQEERCYFKWEGKKKVICPLPKDHGDIEGIDLILGEIWRSLTHET